MNRYYERDKETYKARARANTKIYRKRNQEFVRQYKLSHGCSHCGYKTHWAALDFHHVSEKKETVAVTANKGSSLKALQEEMDKCVVLCANCHRVEHENQREIGRSTPE